jgi:Hemerythrin HHE cation binding domain
MGRANALHAQLVHVHASLRERVQHVRDALSAGDTDAAVERLGHDDLTLHCLSVCAAVRTHHRGEDEQLLPAIGRAHPDLAPVVEALIEDHAQVAAVLGQVEDVARGGISGSDPIPALQAMDGLAAVLDSHFAWEERRIGRALEDLDADAWTPEVFDP